MHRLRSACVLFCLVAVSLLASPFVVAAQTPQPAAAAPPALTYDMAKQVIDAAEAEARKNNWNVVIVVTDAAGVPVMLRRLDGAGARPYDIAMRKAATVVAAKMTTAEYGAQLKAGTVKEVPNGITFAGGVPIMRGGELIGAVLEQPTPGAKITGKRSLLFEKGRAIQTECQCVLIH